MLFIRFGSPTTAELGLCGESIAARYLAGLGWRVVGRRVRTRFAELDLVVEHGDVLVGVEVKTGRASSRPGRDPRAHLGVKTLRRQQKAIRSLGSEAGRIDLVEIAIAADRTHELTHLIGLIPRGTWRSGL